MGYSAKVTSISDSIGHEVFEEKKFSFKLFTILPYEYYRTHALKRVCTDTELTMC